jgi:hypothetical protein
LRRLIHFSCLNCQNLGIALSHADLRRETIGAATAHENTVPAGRPVIDLSGSMTFNANPKWNYVRANCAIQVLYSSFRWFGRWRTKIYPSGTVVGSLHVDWLSSLIGWASIPQIVYNPVLEATAGSSF